MNPNQPSESSDTHFVEIPAEKTPAGLTAAQAESRNMMHLIAIGLLALVLIGIGFFFGQYKGAFSHEKAVKTEQAPVATGAVDTAPPVSQEELSAIPGEKRQEYETQCVTQAMDKAKELNVDVNAFFKLNKNYVNHCVVHLAKGSAIQ